MVLYETLKKDSSVLPILPILLKEDAKRVRRNRRFRADGKSRPVEDVMRRVSWKGSMDCCESSESLALTTTGCGARPSSGRAFQLLWLVMAALSEAMKPVDKRVQRTRLQDFLNCNGFAHLEVIAG